MNLAPKHDELKENGSKAAKNHNSLQFPAIGNAIKNSMQNNFARVLTGRDFTFFLLGNSFYYVFRCFHCSKYKFS
jgi:hypothetical protein